MISQYIPDVNYIKPLHKGDYLQYTPTENGGNQLTYNNYTKPLYRGGNSQHTPAENGEQRSPNIHRRLYTGNKCVKRRRYNNLRENKKLLSNNNVHNLSGYTLPNSFFTLLNKGLGFVPTPGTFNHKKLEREIRELNRKLQICFYFNQNPKKDLSTCTNRLRKPFRINSNWEPNNTNPIINNFCYKLNENMYKAKYKKK